MTSFPASSAPMRSVRLSTPVPLTFRVMGDTARSPTPTATAHGLEAAIIQPCRVRYPPDSLRQAERLSRAAHNTSRGKLK
jgi:hypothetical protein